MQDTVRTQLLDLVFSTVEDALHVVNNMASWLRKIQHIRLVNGFGAGRRLSEMGLPGRSSGI